MTAAGYYAFNAVIVGIHSCCSASWAVDTPAWLRIF
jgi:hypothetical protein